VFRCQHPRSTQSPPTICIAFTVACSRWRWCDAKFRQKLPSPRGSPPTHDWKVLMKFPFPLLLLFITRLGHSTPRLVLTAVVPQCQLLLYPYPPTCKQPLNAETTHAPRRPTFFSFFSQTRRRAAYYCINKRKRSHT
jgi:hypothetical protein